MSEPHRCPVCKGDREMSKDCVGCNGTGVVWEPDGPQESVGETGSPLDLTGS